MRKRKAPLQIFSLSFLDCICCGLGAVLIILLSYAFSIQREANRIAQFQSTIAQQSNDIASLTYRIQSLVGRVATLSSKLGSATNTIVSLSNAYMGISVDFARLSDELRLAQDKNRILGALGGTVQEQLNLIEALSNDLRRAQMANDALSSDLRRAQSTSDALSNDLRRARNTKTILGLPISQKRLVFLIDSSGSMESDQRLADVKGAFKVVLASLDQSYQVDLVSFTTDPNDAYKLDIQHRWNDLRNVTAQNRREAIDFVTQMEATGGTPTATAVELAMKNYPDTDAVVLLSDGEPTDHNDPDQCASAIRDAHQRSIPIYTVGVGSDMAARTSIARQFMERVARESGGKCIAF